MPPNRVKTGGRTALVSPGSIVEAGRRIGLADLSVQAVAHELGVSTTAVYRRVPSRDALETLVGESILADLEPVDVPGEPVAEHLLRFAGRLREFALAHRGVAAYLLRAFPRGPSGGRLLAAEVAALGRRGYPPDAAAVLAGAVAAIALGLVAGEEVRVSGEMAGVPPGMGAERYFRLLVTSAVDGLLTRLPPGRSVDGLTP
ncbi:TetR/AcrR family transcriptional regulator [Saccharothrix obliqua]|uniref:TetR/AcrR family transcriptional regulator n=1 Tax=Saccharothrix obliqua TaxID=2861747 RepID=UPI001C5CC83F|nr:TetR/AcrR family transcriptional regulator [Saccharothrix obliqua]MBW4718337.1 TetR/AcrR family transcriptional regulator [Saccharothrix obliqua]